MKRQLVLILGFLLTSVFTISVVFSSVTSTPGGSFTAEPDSIFLNWTTGFNDSLEIRMAASPADVNSTLISFLNSSLSKNYTQSDHPSISACDDGSLEYFIVAGNGTSSSIIGPLNQSDNETVVVGYYNINCYPGRYFTSTLTVTNTTTNSTLETLNVSVTIDVPISVNNTLSSSTGVGSFNGTLGLSDPLHHSYYFFVYNTSYTPINATFVTVNASGWMSGQEVDLFVFDGSDNLIERSVNNGVSSESVTTSLLRISGSDAWEIRLNDVNSTTGSPTSYNGFVIFSTLNVTNSSNPDLNIVDSVDFGTVSSLSNSTMNFTIENEGNQNVTDVVESFDLKVVKFLEQSSNDTVPANYSFILPDSSLVSYVLVNLTYDVTSGSGHVMNFRVIDPSGSVVGISENKSSMIENHFNSSIYQLQFPMTEINSTSQIPSTSGIWNVEVSSNVTGGNIFDLSVEFGIDPASIMSSNYTVSNFSAVGTSGSLRSVHVYFNTTNSTIPGDYSGNIYYTDSNGGRIKIPVSATLSSPGLSVNGTMLSGSISKTENYGETKVSNISVNVTNTGNSVLVLDTSASMGTLNCISGSCSPGTHSANLTFDNLESVPVSGSTVFNINMSFGESLPTGLYRGYVFFNATNNTPSLSASPYDTFNLTVDLTLSSSVDLYVRDMLDEDGDQIIGNHTNQSRVISLDSEIFFQNDTELTISDLGISNFTGVYLQEGNVTSGTLGRRPSAGYYSLSADTSPIFLGGVYNTNFTLPHPTPGGLYTLTMALGGNLGQNGSYSATTSNGTLMVNNTGLFFATNTSSVAIDNDENGDKVYVNVSNFGPVAQTSTITFDNSTCKWRTAVTASHSDCPVSVTKVNESKIDIALSPFTTSCILVWEVFNTTNDEGNSCSGTVSASSDYSFNSLSISVTPTDNSQSSSDSSSDSSSSSSSSSDSSSTATTTSTSAAEKFLQISKWTTTIEAIQGASKTVEVSVKNIHDDKTQSVSLSATGMPDSIETSVSPSTANIAAGGTSDFKVTFSPGEAVLVDDYAGKFEAKSSDATVSVDFNLHVLPSEATQTTISTEFDEIKAELASLLANITAAEELGVNVSASKALYDQVKSKVDEAQTSIDLGTAEGYFAASQLFPEIRQILETTKSQLRVDTQDPEFQFPVDPLYIGIGIGIAAVGFLVYLFLPTKGMKVNMKDRISIGAGGGRAATFSGLKDKIKGHSSNVASKVGGAATSTGGKFKSVNFYAKEKTSDQLGKLKEKFKLKKEYKYKYEE